MKVSQCLVLLLALLILNAGCGDDGNGGADVTPPEIDAFAIDDDARFTLSRTVSLAVSASDNEGTAGMQVRASTSPDLSGVDWVTYATPLAYELPPGDGVKAVYVQVRDASGNESDVASGEITLAESSTVIYFEPDPMAIAQGVTGTVQIKVANALDMVSARFEISFEASQLEVTEIDASLEGSHILRSTGGALIVSDQDHDNSAGTIVVGALGLMDGFDGVSGDGPFAAITFRAKSALANPTTLTLGAPEIYNYPVSNPPEPFASVFVFNGTIQ
jgi:hypothetical protein